MTIPLKNLVLLLLALIWIGASGPVAGQEQRRVALVIGNSAYAHVPELTNPRNDATDIAAALTRLGFEVTLGLDYDYRNMRLALRDFAELAEDADMVIVYFAGHGVEIDKTNYLIPVNAELTHDRDVEFEAIQLDQVLSTLVHSRGLRIALVDACRNNPFIRTMTRTVASRSLGRGLGRIDPVGGVLVGYAAREGTVALDGSGRNSPYAEALLQYLEEPGLEIGKLFRKVRDSVYETTGGKQEPFTYGSLPGADIYLKPPAVEISVVSIASPTVSVAQELAEAYALADQEGTTAAWDAFIASYGEQSEHPLVRRAIFKRQEIQRERMSATDTAFTKKSKTLDDSAKAIEEELIAYSAAEKLNSPRGWALFFDRFQTGRLMQSAIVREEQAFLSDIQARVFGRYRSAFDGQTVSARMQRVALDLVDIPKERVRQLQWALKSRGNQIGKIDGEIGPRTLQALAAVQQANGLRATGFPTRATLAALGQIDVNFRAPELFRTSGAIAQPIDAESAMYLERDPRIGSMLAVLRTREMIYGYFEGHLYVAVYIGTTYGESELDEILTAMGGKLVEINSPAEQAFVHELVRFDQKLWIRGSSGIRSDYGPTIGLVVNRGKVKWRSGDALIFTAWAPGQPHLAMKEARYGRLVPVGTIARNAHQVGPMGWAIGENISHSIIIEIE